MSWTAQRAVRNMQLQTPRLILRPFTRDDLDPLALLMANSDFMRFSLGVYSREQTAAFLDKLILWQDRGLPPQFAVVHRGDKRLIGQCATTAFAI